MIIQEKSIPHIFRNKYLRDLGGAVMVGGSGGGTVTTVGGDYLPANLYESETYKVNYNTEFLKNLKAALNFLVVGDTILNNLTVNGDSNLKNTNIDGDINLTGKIYVNGEEFKGGNDGESYLKDLKDVNYNWNDSNNQSGYLRYDGDSWQYQSYADLVLLLNSHFISYANLEYLKDILREKNGYKYWTRLGGNSFTAAAGITYEVDLPNHLYDHTKEFFFGEIIVRNNLNLFTIYVTGELTIYDYLQTTINLVYQTSGVDGCFKTYSYECKLDTDNETCKLLFTIYPDEGKDVYLEQSPILLTERFETWARFSYTPTTIPFNWSHYDLDKVSSNSENINYVTDIYGVNGVTIGNTKKFNFGDYPITTLNLESYGITSSPEELNILDGALITTQELNYLQGAKSNIQGLIDTINVDLEGVHETLEDHENKIDTLLERNKTFKFTISEGNTIGFFFTPDPSYPYSVGEDIFDISLSTSLLSGHILASVYIGNLLFAYALYYCYGTISKYIKNIYMRNYHLDYQYPYYDAYALHIVFDEEITRYFDDVYPLEMFVKASDTALIYCEPDSVPPNFDKLQPEFLPVFTERLYKLPIISDGSGDIEINNNKVLITNGENSILLSGNSIELLNKGEILVGNDNKQINITNDEITITDFVNEALIDGKLNDLHIIVQDEITATCKQFEDRINDKTNSWMIPLSNRMNNMEELLGDIEILLDKILGYEANEYLNETLDEIIG